MQTNRCSRGKIRYCSIWLWWIPNPATSDLVRVAKHEVKQMFENSFLIIYYAFWIGSNFGAWFYART